MLERLFLMVVLGSFSFAVACLLKRRGQRLPEMNLPEELRSDSPTLLAFSTARCGQCHQQAVAIRKLEAEEERLRHITLDAIEQMSLANQLSIRTVPSTALFDSQGRLRHLNHGYVGLNKLREQLADSR